MGYYAGARDLRNLLAVATMLRQLGDDTLHNKDRELYQTAAAALETRADWLAKTLPEERGDDEQRDTRTLFRPVDLIV